VEAGVVRTLQAGAVFTELTTLENVLVGGGVRRTHSGVARTLLSTPSSRADAAAARADGLARLDDVGLAHRAHARAGDLSALEQRLLVLATASASRPRALLLDEPAAGAAGRELDRVLAVLRRLRDDGAAVLVVEHDFGLVRRIADHVVVLDAGRIVASGPPQAVASDPAVRAAFLGRRD
jgi:branched-chain amino acid transport system ATP-binding protein